MGSAHSQRLHLGSTYTQTGIKNEISRPQVAGIKMTAFWDIVPCSEITLMTEAVHTSEMLVYFYNSAR
jgi:hypothetical protein